MTLPGFLKFWSLLVICFRFCEYIVCNQETISDSLTHSIAAMEQGLPSALLRFWDSQDFPILPASITSITCTTSCLKVWVGIVWISCGNISHGLGLSKNSLPLIFVFLCSLVSFSIPALDVLSPVGNIDKNHPACLSGSQVQLFWEGLWLAHP